MDPVMPQGWWMNLPVSGGPAVNRNHSESTVRQIGVVFNVVIRISVRCYLYLPAALALNLSGEADLLAPLLRQFSSPPHASI